MTLLFSRRGARSSPFDSGIWFVGVIILVILAFFLRDLSPLVSRFLGIACVVVIIWAIVRGFRRPARHNVKQWRGRDIDIAPGSRPEWLDRWLRNRRPPRPPYR